MARVTKLVDGILGPQKTRGYRPTMGLGFPGMTSGPSLFGMFSLGVIDDMRRDWQVSQALRFKTSPLHTAEFEVKASNERVRAFVESTLDRYWRHSLGVGLECVSFGFAGLEPAYEFKNGKVVFDRLDPIHPRDVEPYTYRGELSYIRVQNLTSRDGDDLDERTLDRGYAVLDAASVTVPAKGFWVTHDAKYSRWYGRPLMMPSWWPWRCKTMPDGAMQTAFTAYYKHAFMGMVVRHPDESYRDSMHGPEITAQEYVQQLGEQIKAGANIALSGRRDERGNYLYEIERYGGESSGDFRGLLEYPDWLDRLIVRGMGIPDEILTFQGGQVSYARANVALLAFLIMAEETLNHHLEEFDSQIMRPLVRVNFGRESWYKIKPKPLMPDPGQMQQDGQGLLGGQPPPGGQPPGAMPGAGGQPPAMSLELSSGDGVIADLRREFEPLRAGGEGCPLFWHPEKRLAWLAPQAGGGQFDVGEVVERLGRIADGVKVVPGRPPPSHAGWIDVWREDGASGMAADGLNMAKDGRVYSKERPGEGWTRHVGPNKGVYWLPPKKVERSAILDGLASLGKKAMGAVHAVEEAVAKRVESLPSSMRLPVLGAYHLTFLTYTAGQKMAHAVAKEVGGEEHADSVARVLAVADLVGAKANPAVAAMVGVSGGASLAAAFVPIGSMTYLAVSTVKNPIAVIKAARKAVRRVTGKKDASCPRSDEARVMAVAKLTKLMARNSPDEVLALVFAAIDETHDLCEAVDVVARVVGE